MRRNKKVKKKNEGSRLGYYPFCAWSRYNRLYRDTIGMGTQGMGHDTARAWLRYGRACATIRRSVRAIQLSARTGGLASGECRDTKIVSWLGVAFVSQ